MMDLDDTLKFFNRIGVRVVNDVTAQVTANVTAAMDPKCTGVHMPPSAAPLPLGEDAEEVSAAAPALVPEIAAPKDMLGMIVEFGKIMANTMVTSSQTVHDSALNVIVHKVAQIIEYVDDKVAGIDDKIAGIDDKVAGIDDKVAGIDDKVAQLEKRLLSLESPKKSKKPKTAQRSTVAPNISLAHGKYCWRKTIGKKRGYKGAYKTMHEAKQGLKHFCQEQLNPAAAMED